MFSTWEYATYMSVHSVHDFQPRTQYPIEDRHLVEDWKLSNGNWKFIGIFDGSCLRLV